MNAIYHFLIGIFTLNLILSTGTIVPPAQAQQESIHISIAPGTIFYPVKLFLESAREAMTINPIQKVNVQQEHLQERLNELQYEAQFNNNKNSEQLIQEIQEKRTSIQTAIMDINEVPDAIKYRTLDEYRESTTEETEELISSILSIKSVSAIKSLIPYRRVMYYDPQEQEWHGAVLDDSGNFSITTPIENPEVTLYPTEGQITSFKEIITDVNINGFTTTNQLKLTQLYLAIKKVTGEN